MSSSFFCEENLVDKGDSLSSKVSRRGIKEADSIFMNQPFNIIIHLNQHYGTLVAHHPSLLKHQSTFQIVLVLHQLRLLQFVEAS